MRLDRISGARLAALILALGAVAPAWAQDGSSPFEDPDRRQERLEPPLSLPESFNGVIRPGTGEPAPARIDRLSDIGRMMQACWQPSGVKYSGQEITIRVSFKRNGEVFGKPMITHYRAGQPNAENRQAFTQAVRDAFVRCSPMPFSDRLGAAVAGRPFTFRFVDAPVAQRSQSL
jgi:hypothetical protein